MYTHQNPNMAWLLLFLHVWGPAACPDLSPSPQIHTHVHTHTQRVLLLLHAWDSVTCPYLSFMPRPQRSDIQRYTYIKKKIHIHAHTHTDTHTLLHPGAHNSMAFPIMMHVGHVAVHPSSPTSRAHRLSELLWPWEPAGLAPQLSLEKTIVITCVHWALLLWDS